MTILSSNIKNWNSIYIYTYFLYYLTNFINIDFIVVFKKKFIL